MATSFRLYVKNLPYFWTNLSITHHNLIQFSLLKWVRVGSFD